jgi:hypothetical protein
VGRKPFAVVLVVVVAVAVVMAVAAASGGGGGGAKTPPARPAVSNGLGDDDANLMRQLQRDKLAKSHK